MNYFPFYFKQSVRLLLSRPRSSSPIALMRGYRRWLTSLHRSAMIDEQPWITFSAIDYLQSILTREMSVFEYGGGGSTLFFAKRAQRVVTVEHDPEWAAKLRRALAERDYNNCDVRTVQPDLRTAGAQNGIHEYVSTDPNYTGMTFETYVKQIESFPDGSFDIVVIDGRARPSCLMHAVKKVRHGGYIVMDNTDRSEYKSAMNRLPYKRRDFCGPCPYVPQFTATSIWRVI